MITVHLEHLGESIDVPFGFPLVDLDGKIRFGCRAAACGRCAIKIFDGQEHLSVENEKERRAKGILGLCGPSERLACQVTVHGNLRLGPLDKKERKQ